MSKRDDRKLDSGRERAAIRAVLRGARPRLIHRTRWIKPLRDPESRAC